MSCFWVCKNCSAICAEICEGIAPRYVQRSVRGLQVPQSEAGIACCEHSHHDLPSAQALQNAIDAVKPGVRYREVGDIISHHVGMQGFQVVRSYCGHGICDLFHCAPNLPHYARNKVQRHFLSRILLPHLALLGVVIYCSLSSIIVKRTVPPTIDFQCS